MTHMTSAQRDTMNAATFRQKLSILHRASVGVMLCRSSEPYRAIDAIRDFSWAENGMGFKYWTVLNGWHTPDKSRPDQAPMTDNMGDLLAALRAIGGAGAADAGFDNGVYVVMYPHHWVGKMPPLIQLIKDYARTLPETKKRVILMCPPEFSLPIELRDDVVILDFELPSYGELREVYARTISAFDTSKRPKYTEEDVDRIISAGAGMTAHEFETALSRAIIANRELLPRIPIDKIISGVMEVKVEAVKRTEVLEVMPVENMENVGGLQNLKTWVEMRRGCFGQDAADYGIDPLKGFMLVGPPGTGKSLVSKATAHALGLPLIKFDIGRVFASLVGQSEQRVREALKMAEAMSPCVLFIDEVDKALGGSHSGGGDSGVSQRVLGAILTWLQENTSPVFVVFSANRVENLPSELIRKGRLDEIFAVSVPNAEERRQVLTIHLRKRKQVHEIDLDAAIENSEGFVPAELEAAVKDALIRAYTSKMPVTGAMIAEELRAMTPLSVAFAEQFEAMRTWADQNARPANGSPTSRAGATRERVRQRSGGAVAPTGAGRQVDMA